MMYHLLPIAAIVLLSYVSTALAEEWDFLVMTDWHRGEVFATEPGPNTENYKIRFDTLSHIRSNYGGELVVMPGDVATGKWHRPEYIAKFFPGLSREEAVLKAGMNCYSTIRNLFTESGWSKILVAVGDHEYGDNYWEPNSDKTNSLPQFHEAFTKAFYFDSLGKFKYNDNIGKAKATPEGTKFEYTSFAHKHRNVLFVTIDSFTQVTQDTNYFDPVSSRGGEGVVTGTVEGEHLKWLESVLKEGSSDSTIDFIIVQSHLPVLTPTRKTSSSAMNFDDGADSEFWKLLVQYGVTAYLGGEVHTITATKDANSNLVQIISRANFNSGFLKFFVTDTELRIVAYGEKGPLGRDNRNYEEIGLMKLPKDPLQTISSSGVLDLIDLNKPLIHFSFDESVNLRDRLIDGMGSKETLNLDSIEIRGIDCNKAIPNQGEFGQQYDAQFGNVDIHVGVIGNAALFTPDSRMSVYSMGPHSGGAVISYSFWFKTKGYGEMILLHYAPRWNLTQGGQKHIFSLTLKDGKPTLYASKTSLLSAESEALNDGKWHNVAVSMPWASCHLSQVKIIVDGQQTTTTSVNSVNLYLVPHGQLGFGGFGYSTTPDSDFPNWKPYEGKIDEFFLWAKPIDAESNAVVQTKEFIISKDHRCRQNKARYDFVQTEETNGWDCQSDCIQQISCIGYEVKQKLNGNFRCLKFSGRAPKLGKQVTKDGHRPTCALLA